MSKNMIPANAVFMITPDGRTIGEGRVQNDGSVRPVQMTQQTPMMFRPRMPAMGSDVESGIKDILEVAQAGATLIWARPATVQPPTDVADVAQNQRNQTLYTAAVANSTLSAKRNEVLISESARVLRAVVNFAERRRSQGRPVISW